MLTLFPSRGAEFRSQRREAVSLNGVRAARSYSSVSSDEKLMTVSLKLEGDSVTPAAPSDLFRLPIRGAGVASRFEAAADGRSSWF